MDGDVFVFLEVFSTEGGIQSYIKDFLKAYIDAGSGRADVFLLRDYPECDNFLEGSGLKFHYLNTRPRFLGRFFLAIRLLICLLPKKRRRVFCGHVKLAPLIYFLCRFLAIPYTVLTYGKEVWQPLGFFYKIALQNADCIWSISRYSRDCSVVANNLDVSKFQLLPCAVDGEIFKPAPKREDLLAKYGLYNCRVLMTVARLWSGDIYKGVDVTIRALPLILRNYENVKYLVIGRGDDRPRLEALARDLGVADRVVFAGFVPAIELPDYYRLADVYVMPSQEGFGIVYLEAMASGVPVVAGDGDGSADALQDGKLGWRVPHRHPEAVATACGEILGGGDRRCDGNWLRQETLAAFGVVAFTQQVKQLLDL